MILTLDYALVDGNPPPDVAKARAAGVSVVYQRKYQHLRGRHLNDAHYARDIDAWRRAGVVVGAYMFPGLTIYDLTPKEQVKAFKSAPGDMIPGQDMPPCLDIEPGTGGWSSTGHSKTEIVALLEQLVRELEDQFGCKPMIYTSQNQAWDLGLRSPSWLLDCPLWVKTAYRLAAKHPVDQVIPREPHVGTDAVHDPRDYYRIPDAWARSGYWMQQFQGDAIGFPGLAKTVDVGRFHAAKRGMCSEHVLWLYRKLMRLEDGPVDEKLEFDEFLENTVKAFQTKHGLVVDGIVGPRTFAKLAWTCTDKV